jgi:hypothetical protein
MKNVEFLVMLTAEDRYRHQHARLRGKIIKFSVQYETKVGQTWLPVVRFDTSHGFAHRDLLDAKGGKRKTPIFAKDLNEALIFAEADIKSNWHMYKEQFLRSINHGYKGE